MIDLVLWAFCFAAGAAIGAAYLVMLWTAVQRLARHRSIGGFLGIGALRAGMILGAVALGLVLDVGAGGLLSGLAGFTVVRFSMARLKETRVWKGASWK